MQQGVALKDKGKTMKIDKLINGLALLGIVIVMIGVTYAANTAADGFDTTLKIEAPAAN